MRLISYSTGSILAITSPADTHAPSRTGTSITGPPTCACSGALRMAVAWPSALTQRTNVPRCTSAPSTGTATPVANADAAAVLCAAALAESTVALSSELSEESSLFSWSRR